LILNTIYSIRHRRINSAYQMFDTSGASLNTNLMDYTNYDDDLMMRARTSGEYDKVMQALKEKWGDGCPYCKLSEKYIVKEIGDWVLTSNLFPYTNYQLVIIPRRHIQSFGDITGKDWETVRQLIYIGIKALQRVYGQKDFNVYYQQGKDASQSLKHLHINILPMTDNADILVKNFKQVTISPRQNSEKLKAEIESAKFKKRVGERLKNNL